MSKGFTNSIIGGAGEGLYVWKKYSVSSRSASFTATATTTSSTDTPTFTLTSSDIDLTNTTITDLVGLVIQVVSGSNTYTYAVNSGGSYTRTLLSDGSTYTGTATYVASTKRITFSHSGYYVSCNTVTVVGTPTIVAKGDFIGYITSDSILSYPVDGQKGDYWYELVQSNVDWGEVTLTTATTEITVNHNLGEKPKWAGIFPNEKTTSLAPPPSISQRALECRLMNNGAYWLSIRDVSGAPSVTYTNIPSTDIDSSKIVFKEGYNWATSSDGNGYGTYYWFALGSPKSLLSILSWQQIGDLVLKAEQGTVNLSDYFSVGDTKPVTLTTGETIELQIAGFNHDTFSDGVTAPVTFVMKNCLNTKAQMNSSNTNAGGYPASAMKSWINTNIYDKLPSDLKTLVAPVKKKWYTTYNDASSLTEGNYNVWLLSEMEVSGTNTYTIGNGEGSKYDIFTDNASRIKRVNGTADRWWLGSCGRNDSSSFVSVNSGGSVSDNNYAGDSGGVAAGLCIRGQSGDL